MDKGISSFYFAVILASYAISTFVSSFFIGYWLDRRPMKEVVLFLVFVSVLGNLMYSMSISTHMVLIARLISGISGNIFACTDTYIIRKFTMEERTTKFALISMVQSFGLLLGPPLNYPLSLLPSLHWKIFKLNPLNSPGYLMMFFFATSFLMILFNFEEPPKRIDEQLESKSFKDKIVAYKTIITSVTATLLFLQGVQVFNQVCLETVLTPLTKQFYNFGQLYNSFMYGGVTVLMIIMFGLVSCLTKIVKDRIIIMTGNIMQGGGIISMFALFWAHNNDWVPPFWLFMLVISIWVLGLPFFMVTVSSLYSKFIEPTKQGMGQSFMGGIISLSFMLAPIWSGYTLSLG
eukprot:TRINITY_DN13779_c0_g1_i1.p1 TRINITY_DN13779_c0_g1~~TRINITY_DN13779_c0_g1_i1.p1  ORF type:complete len:383 (-),score=39.35 TRINITY_DN13779_c0_g1_i1:154-1197(-)